MKNDSNYPKSSKRGSRVLKNLKIPNWEIEDTTAQWVRVLEGLSKDQSRDHSTKSERQKTQR